MSPLLEVSDDVRAEIGDDEADRLLAGENAPGPYDCTSCRAPGDTGHVPSSAVLFVGEETAVLAFAHAVCTPSQVVQVSEEQVQGAVRTITAGAAAGQHSAPGAADYGYGPATHPAPAPGTQYGHVPQQGHGPAQADPQQYGASGYGAGYEYPGAAAAGPAPHSAPQTHFPHGSAATAAPPAPPAAPAPGRQAPERAVLSVTCGQVMIGDTVHSAVVVEPTTRIARPGSQGTGDDFLPLLLEQGFHRATGLRQSPAPVTGWSVLVAMGRLHAILQPPSGGSLQPGVWWQAHQALPVTDAWRESANKHQQVLVYAAPTGSIGQQPREDLLREALVQAAARGELVAATMPLAGS